MKIGYGSGIKIYKEIVLLQLIGASMILACHFFQKENIAPLGELFISGVPLFLFVSGFLSGLKNGNYQKWLIKRAIRILIPFFLWVIPSMIILWINDHALISKGQVFFILTNMQGLNYIYWKSELYSSVAGLGHLWFTTVIMVCYLLVPIFNKLVNMGFKNKTWIIIICIMILIVQPCLTQIGIQSSYIITFFLGYLISKKGCVITNKLLINLSFLVFIVTLLRFILMRIIDGSNYYDRYFALISAATIGIWIFFIMFWISSKRPMLVQTISKNNWIAYLSNISFEIYIVHFWFLEGKWQIAKYISNVIFSDFIVVIITIIFASMLHFVSQKLVSLINYRMKVI